MSLDASSVADQKSWRYYLNNFCSQARKLRKYKERRLNGYHGGPNMGENLADVLDSIDEVDTEVDNASLDAEEDASFMDPEQAVITKVKRWDGELLLFVKFLSHVQV